MSPYVNIEQRIAMMLPEAHAAQPSMQWRFWERRTFNAQRVIGHWTTRQEVSSVGQLGESIRQPIETAFPASWWRGMAFAAVVTLPNLLLPLPDLAEIVDTRARRRGTCQWLIVHCTEQNLAFGIHTWMEVSLSPVYRAILTEFAACDIDVASLKRNKGRLMNVLVSAARMNHTIKTLGLGTTPVSEFRDTW